MYLLSFAGANVNAMDQGLLTPLHRAAASKNEVYSHFKMKREMELGQDLTNVLLLSSLNFVICRELWSCY